MINLRFTPAIFLALFAACGSGGGNGSGTSPTPTSITAIDGYLSGSEAVCDANSDGLKDPGEISVTTTVAGVATFTDGCKFPVIVTGGINVDTNVAFTGQLRTPANATVATPLTTLIASGMSEADVRSALGLSTTASLLNTDPLKTDATGVTANPELLKKTWAVQQMMKTTADTVGGASGITKLTDAQNQALYAEVAKSFVSALTDGGVKTLMVNGDTGSADATIMTSMVKKAVEQVKASTNTALGSVKTLSANLDADTVAEVASAGIHLRTEALLKGDVSSVSKAAAFTEFFGKSQKDTTLLDKVKANKTTLEKPPSDESKNLGDSVKRDIASVVKEGGGTVVPPTNYLALVGDAISVDAGSALTMDAFQTASGISLAWPLTSASKMNLTIGTVGAYELPPDLKVSAAISIEETGQGNGKFMAYLEKVAVSKTSSGALSIAIPTDVVAKAYMLSTDKKKLKTVDIASSVKSIANTLTVNTGLTGAALTNTVIQIGDVADYASRAAAKDGFTGINSLTGKFKVSVVVTDMPLRKANGDELPSLTISVPIELNADGTTKNFKVISGRGLTGYITLTK